MEGEIQLSHCIGERAQIRPAAELPASPQTNRKNESLCLKPASLGLALGSSFYTQRHQGTERSYVWPQDAQLEARASESKSYSALGSGVAAQSPQGPTGREKLEDVSALTSLQLGEVVLPQEAAGHEHREQKEEAAGSWEKPLLFYFQRAEPPASLEWGRHRAQLPWESARGRKERDPHPGPFYTLSSPRHHGSPQGSSNIYTHFTPGKPRSFPV